MNTKVKVAEGTTPSQNTEKRFKRKLNGVVVSDVNDKTIVVNVVRRFKHPQYSKFIHISKKYHAHDEANSAKKGQEVVIIESRPYSKMKRWELFSIRNESATEAQLS